MLRAGYTLSDRYVLREPVARGGMGQVWRADDVVLGRVVAVKVLLPELSGDPGFAQRFRVEAHAMASLSDPHIVEVYDYGQADGMAYLVMQFVPGESLHGLLHQGGPLSPYHAMMVVAQAAQALQVAHDNGIVHRDVKPGNLLIRPDGRLVLTDFGIARMVTAESLTATGDILGTVSYLAPEQILAEPITPSTDLYALGVVAYQCLTLTPPFVADTPVAVALMHTRDAPPPLPVGVPDPVAQVVMVALAKDPRDRWPSAAAMGQAAMAAADGAATAPPIPVSPGRRVGPGPHTSTSPRPGAPLRTGALRTNVPSTNTGQIRIHGRARPPARSREAARGRLAWVAAAAGVLLVLACAGWVALSRDRGTPEQAAPPAASTTTTSTTAITSPTAGPPATASPTPPRTTTTPARPTSPSPTAPRTPGPNEVYVPDVTGMYKTAADYAIRSKGLNPVLIVTTVPDHCGVKYTDPAKDTIVSKNSTVNVYVEEDNPSCQPL
jgi:eukaryotic-like serine/threonine-protein kinase